MCRGVGRCFVIGGGGGGGGGAPVIHVAMAKNA